MYIVTDSKGCVYTISMSAQFTSNILIMSFKCFSDSSIIPFVLRNKKINHSIIFKKKCSSSHTIIYSTTILIVYIAVYCPHAIMYSTILIVYIAEPAVYIGQ